MINSIKMQVRELLGTQNPVTGFGVGENILLFDAVLSEEINQTYKHSSYPSQAGSEISYNLHRDPIKLTIVVAHGDFAPKDLYATGVASIANLALNKTIGSKIARRGIRYISSSLDLLETTQEKRSAKALNNILNQANQLTKFDIQTSKKTYSNMVIVGINSLVNPENENGVLIKIELEERKEHVSSNNAVDVSKMDITAATSRLHKIKKIGNAVRSLL